MVLDCLQVKLKVTTDFSFDRWDLGASYPNLNNVICHRKIVKRFSSLTRVWYPFGAARRVWSIGTRMSEPACRNLHIGCGISSKLYDESPKVKVKAALISHRKKTLEQTG